MIGRKLSHYEILDELGSGGMGDVYLAKDTKLGREVAIKVLPEDFAADEERLARFRREAQVLAALNHPNIAAIYGLEEDDGVHYLALELVPGETLAERLARGRLSQEETIRIARQIVDALEEAHEKGIVHRDLKPANVKLTEDGKVKVLDFGLAKAFTEEAAEVDSSLSPTLTRDATHVGAIMGTAAYMSPEQARGKSVDKRSDIFSLGSVLYEMLTGRKAFPGEDVSEILAAVIKTEPSAIQGYLDPRLLRLLERCLNKDPRERFRDVGDVRIALEEIVREPVSSVQLPRRPRLWPAVVGAVVAALLTWAILGARDANRPRPGVRRATITLPEGQTQPRVPLQPLALSPDGNLLAYVADDADGRRLFLRSLDSFETTRLSGTEGADIPFFSPEGEWIGFFAAGQLKKVSIARGAVLTIARASDPLGASWGPTVGSFSVHIRTGASFESLKMVALPSA